MTYAKKCQAPQDKQPIVLSKAELEEIDSKTNHKNEGYSYYKAYKIDGIDRPDLYYICPKFWDRKHQIPLAPPDESKPETFYHPIEKDDSGSPVKWYPDLVWERGIKDNSRYILERTGRGVGKTDKDSFWNLYESDKNDIKKYNVQFIHDDVHPDLYPLPCCGRKEMENIIGVKKINTSDPPRVNVLIREKNKKPYWKLATVVSNFDKDSYCHVKFQYESKTKKVHISSLKPYKGDKTQLVYDYPLKMDSNGHINKILKEFYYIREEAPTPNKIGGNGFYRKGIPQTYDSFLECIDLLHITNPTIKDKSPSEKKYDILRGKKNLKELKSNIILDIKDPKINIETIADGKFFQMFRPITMEKNDSYSIRDYIIDNFEKYISSPEYKDVRLLMSVLYAISRLNNNKTFEGMMLNFILFEDQEDKIEIIEPYGGFDYLLEEKEIPMAFIYKKGDIIEPLIYRYGNGNFGYLPYDNNNNFSEKSDIIYQGKIGKIKSIKSNIIDIEFVEKKIKEVISVDKNKEKIIKLNSSIIINKTIQIIIDKFVDKNQNSREYINEEQLDEIMKSLNTQKDTYEKFAYKGHFDKYHHLTHSIYRKKTNDKITKVIVPIKPKPMRSYPRLKDINDLPKLKLKNVLSYLQKIDSKLEELSLPNQKYLDGNEKILITKTNKIVALILSKGSFIRLGGDKDNTYYYNKSYYYKTESNKRLKKYISSVYNKGYETDLEYPLGNITNDSMTEFFEQENKINQKMFTDYSKLYLKIKRDKEMIKKVLYYLKHDIMLNIHKRIELLKLLQSVFDELNYNDIKLQKKFIEFLLTNDFDSLHKSLIHSFIDLKELKIKNSNEKDIILTRNDIMNGLHMKLFKEKSKYCNDISFYNEYNPDYKFRIQKSIALKENVSLESKTPNSLYEILGRDINIIRNLEEDDDLDILLESINLKENIQDLDIKTRADIKTLLSNNISDNIDLYMNYNDTEIENKSNYTKHILELLKEDNYHLSPVDLFKISEACNIGIFLFTNRYSEKDKFLPYLIIGKNVFNSEIVKDLDFPFISFYCDYDNSPILKPIEHYNKRVTNIKDHKNRYFTKLLMNTYNQLK